MPDTQVLITRGAAPQTTEPVGHQQQRVAAPSMAWPRAATDLCLFLPAGTWRWPEAWLFIASFAGSSLAITLWVMRHDPASLERRLEAGPRAETHPLQEVMQDIASLAFVATMIVTTSTIATAARALRARTRDRLIPHVW
jgi:hypothetical protein